MSNIEDFDLLEIPDVSNTISMNGYSVNATEICCLDTHTQFSKRMRNCESLSHTAASKIETSSSLDAVIKVINQNSEFDLFKTINYEILKPKQADDYASDHDGVKVRLQTKNLIPHPRLDFRSNFSFNLVSFNLEGLCRQKGNYTIFQERLKNLKNILTPIVDSGFIMVCQEIVLQKIDSQDEILEENGKTIKTNISNDKVKLNFKSDGFTGGIFYDSNVWKLEKTVEIKREGSNKKSNAYLLSLKSNGDKLWVVNIHLKAIMSAQTPTRSNFMTNLMYYTGVETSDRKHSNELNNIINTVEKHNRRFKYPVYFCGDYNTSTNKSNLFRMTMEDL